MTTETTQELTVLLDLTQTEKDLQLAEQKHMNVVYDVKVPKEMQAAKQARKELKTMRTTVEGKRLEAGRVLLSMKEKNDEKAKGLIARIAAMEDPIDASIKAEEARVEAEKQAEILANNARIEAHREAIKRMREFPMSLQGKPADVIEIKISALVKETTLRVGDDIIPWCTQFDEFEAEADDALKAALASSRELLGRAREQEERDRIAAENERKLREMEERNAQLEREAEARREADEKREREEREAAERKEREAREAEEAAERARLQAIEDAKEAERREEMRQQRLAEQARLEAQRQAQEEKDRLQRAEQERLDQQRREHAAQVEIERQKNLSMRDAVIAVLYWFENNIDEGKRPKEYLDLHMMFHREDVKVAEAAQAKREASQPTRSKVR